MAVSYKQEKKIFKLDTANTTYLIGLSPEGYVGHIYYGDRLYLDADNYLLCMEEHPYTPSVNKREKSAFLDFYPMEFPSGGVGDYRESRYVQAASFSTILMKFIKGKKVLRDFRHLSEQKRKWKHLISSAQMNCLD